MKSQTQPPLRSQEEIHVIKGFSHSLSEKERESIRKSLEQEREKYKDIDKVRSREKSMDRSR